MAGNAGSRANFVSNLTQFCIDNNLDGGDLDWEPVSSGADKNNYSQLVQDLHDSFLPHDLKLTVAVASTGSEIRAWAIEYVDWLNIMAYDMGYPHSTYTAAVAALSYW